MCIVTILLFCWYYFIFCLSVSVQVFAATEVFIPNNKSLPKNKTFTSLHLKRTKVPERNQGIVDDIHVWKNSASGSSGESRAATFLNCKIIKKKMKQNQQILYIIRRMKKNLWTFLSPYFVGTYHVRHVKGTYHCLIVQLVMHELLFSDQKPCSLYSIPVLDSVIIMVKMVQVSVAL